MEYKIVLKNEVWDEVHTLMHNIKTLNQGNEIGGWLTGEWKSKDETMILYLNKFIIPEQTVSKTEVDISPESMIDTIKQLNGNIEGQICAHWHIHPFGTGDTSWSATDDAKIKQFTDPDKERELFVFLLSSEDKIKGRIIINGNINLKQQKNKIPIKLDYDDITVEREQMKEETELLKQLKETIKNKVTVKTYTPMKTSSYSSFTKKESKILDTYKIKIKKNKVLASIDSETLQLLIKGKFLAEEYTAPDQIQEQNGRTYWVWLFKTNKEAKIFSSEFREEIEIAMDEIEEDNGYYMEKSANYIY